jgi:hypothetical protein
MFDYTDFYITGKNDPNYVDLELIEDDVIYVILQKYKMILFTTKGEVMGDYDLGADLELLLFETSVSESYIQGTIYDQINNYIPELINMNYTLEAVFVKNPTSQYDTLYIYFKLSDYEVYAQFGKSIN